MMIPFRKNQPIEGEEEEAKKICQRIRKDQIGTGDRSEKIRTYNMLQDRITDTVLKNHGTILKILKGTWTR